MSEIDDTNPEYDLKRIKNKRAQIRAELTRFQNFLSKDNVQDSIDLLQVRYDTVKSVLEKLKVVQTEYEELLLSDFPDNYNEDQLAEEREEFETRYFQAIAAARRILDSRFVYNYQLRAAGQQIPPSNDFDSHSNNGQSGAGVAAAGGVAFNANPVLPNVAAKLPLLTLPEFSGSYGEWQRFKDMFRAIVHNNNTLSDVQRFYYLEASLKGEPKNIIASLAPTDANYLTAWQLLEKRYDNKKIIINSHLKEIMELPMCGKESHSSLRNLSNSFFKNYRSLEALGENVSEWNTILIYILVTKLDTNTKREWEKYSQGKSNLKVDDFNEFIIQRCQILESLDTKACSSHGSKSFITTKTNYTPKCPYCKDGHFIYFCEKFKQLSVPDRIEKTKALNLCTNCLRFGHKLSECRSAGCKICRQRHATLLHKSVDNSKISRDNSKKSDSSNTEQPTNQNFLAEVKEDLENDSESVSAESQIKSVMSNTCQNSINSFILLSTAVVYAYDKDKRAVPCRLLLDSASQSNFVTSSLIQKLGLHTAKIDIPIIGINQIKTKINRRAEISIASRHTGYKTKLNFLVLPTITEFTPQRHFDISKFNIPQELPLADSNFNIPAEIDMLLGCEVFFELLCVGQIKLGKNLPILQKTLLGWIVSGQVPCGQGKIGKSDVALSNCFFTQETLDKNLEKFWLIEEVSSSSRAKMSTEEIECENYFKETTTRDQNGRFIVKLPLKHNYTQLGESEGSALNRLYSIERRISKNPDLETSYRTFMKEYQDLGHMTEIPREAFSKTPIYYIPHHFVEKPDSTTTKLRVVFDAASKTSTNISLNNVLKIGPTIQNDLFSVILRFRRHAFVLIGDLTKMYRQVLIDKDERNLQRIVWRDSPKENVKHFQLNTVTYGTASASFLSTRCLFQIALDSAEKWPTESDVIASDFYIDDLLTGTSDVESLIEIRRNICNILSEYGFELRKFQSNDHRIIEDLNQTSESLPEKYVINNDSSIKTLGVSWIPNRDCFEYNSHSLSTVHEKVTKRNILSFIAKIFDPLGILGPLSIRAKILIQRLWHLKIGWDESVPNQLYSEWLDLRNEISQVGSLHVPRHVLIKQPKIIEIHGFSDASEKAYASCIYLRSIDAGNQIESHLLCAKSRVSPLKSLSLPRLELLGALLLARLMKKCIDTLNLKLSRVFLWTDSTIVLSWISNEPKTWKTFVANRVAEIQQLTLVENWNYVPSQKNPADIISRGASIKDLVNSKLWLHGPGFFENTNEWPRSTDTNYKRAATDMPELKPISNTAFIVQRVDIDIFERFSDLNKLIRVVAYCLRFFHNLKSPLEARQYGSLSLVEIQNSELILIKLVQLQSFASELHSLTKRDCVSSKSKLKSLFPFLDENGIIRVGGRLGHSALAYDVKHQIILPSNHNFTKCLVDREHKRTLHAGVQGTLSHVRQKYWPLNGKHIVKSCIRKCIACFKANPKITFPRMGDLPSPRITPSRPFLSVAVDYAGPFDLKDGKTRTNKIIKGYICIFVCLVTKAVHIEVITDLTSDGFLSLLKRFVSRRGLCLHIYSDNATNFIGCNNELISVQRLIESSNVRNYSVHSNIQWHFLPARSPHFGGLHEAAVKSCKHHLKRVLNGSHLHYEEFYTLTTQVEAILNSRPLIPMSSDPNDLSALTPAHFLIGQELTAIPERDLTGDKVNHVKRFKHLQLIGQHFWARWRKEYLHHLQQRTRWQFDKNPELQIGAMVLLTEDNIPPIYWPLGRIVETYPGKDNIVRVVSVKTNSGLFKRSVTRVALLPLN